MFTNDYHEKKTLLERKRQVEGTFRPKLQIFCLAHRPKKRFFSMGKEDMATRFSPTDREDQTGIMNI